MRNVLLKKAKLEQLTVPATSIQPGDTVYGHGAAFTVVHARPEVDEVSVVGRGVAIRLDPEQRVDITRRVYATTAKVPEFLYHGTSSLVLPGILKDGLRERSYFASELMAVWFAKMAAAQTKSAPVLIRIPTSRINVKYLDKVNRLLPAATGAKDERIWRYLHTVEVFNEDIIKVSSRFASSRLTPTSKTAATDIEEREFANQFPDEHAYLKHHNTGYIQPDAYDKHNFNWVKLENYPKLLKQVTLKGGEIIDFRQEGTKNSYVKLGPDGWGLRDEKDNPVYMSDEEIASAGLPVYATSIMAFNDEGKCVGQASDEFGADGIWVSPEYQKKGLGVQLLTDFRRQFKKVRQMGQMTPAGQQLTKNYYRSLTGKEPTPMKDEYDDPNYLAQRALWGFFANANLDKISEGQRAEFGRLQHEADNVKEEDAPALLKKVREWSNQQPAGTFGSHAENALMGKTASKFRNELLQKSALAYLTLADIEQIAREMMPILKSGLPVPEFKIVNQVRSKWLGRCNWTFRNDGTCDDNTLIEIQKAALVDILTLKRVVSHEMAHHEDNLTNEKKEFEEKGFARFQLSLKYKNGHGATWKAIAARFNAKYGEGFVTEKSDENYITEDNTPKSYFVWMHRYVNGKLMWQAGLKLSPKQVEYMIGRREEKAKGSYDYRLYKTDDPAFFSAPPIGLAKGDRYVRDTEPELHNKTEKLWVEGEDLLPALELPKGKTAARDLTSTPSFKEWFGDSKAVKDGKPIVFFHGTDANFDTFETKPGLRGDGGIFEEKVHSPFKFFTTDISYAADVAAHKGARGNILRVYLKMENPLDLTTPKGLAVMHRIFGVFKGEDEVDALHAKMEELQQELKEVEEWVPVARVWFVRRDAQGRAVAESSREGNGYVRENVSLEQAQQEKVEQIADTKADIAELQQQLDDLVGSKGQPSSIWDYLDQPDSADKLKAAGYDSVIFRENEGNESYAVIDSAQIKEVRNVGTFDPSNPSIRASKTANSVSYCYLITPTEILSADGDGMHPELITQYGFKNGDEARAAGCVRAILQDDDGDTILLLQLDDLKAAGELAIKFIRNEKPDRVTIDINPNGKGNFVYEHSIYPGRAIEFIRSTCTRGAGKTAATPPASLLVNPAFKAWFGNSKVVDESGTPKVVYRGDYRADRIGDTFKVNRSKAGRFYFTDDPEIANGYANKVDDGHEDEDNPYYFADWFKFPAKKSPREKIVPTLRNLWWKLTPEEKNRVKQVVETTSTEDCEVKLDAGTPICGQNSLDYAVQKFRGNWLLVAYDLWLGSGALFDNEKEFSKLLDHMGLEHEYDNPYDPRSVVTPVYLSIQNPLDTTAIPENVVNHFRAMAKADRSRSKSYSGGTWDKNAQTVREWVEELEYDLKNGTTHAWTTIPEKITKALQSFGFDGVKDLGGKNGGTGHTVWIAFEPNQIKSAIGNNGKFDPSKARIKAGAKTASSPAILWARQNGKLFSTSRMETRPHAHWFETIGIPFSGPAFDKIQRGKVKLDPRTKSAYFELMSQGEYTPNDVVQFITNKYNLNGWNIREVESPKYAAKTAGETIGSDVVIAYIQKLNKWDKQTAYNVLGTDGIGSNYTLREFPLSRLKAGDDWNPARSKEYAALPTPFPPIVLGYDWNWTTRKKKLVIKDGNHRVDAAKQRGDKTIQAYVPIDDEKVTPPRRKSPGTPGGGWNNPLLSSMNKAGYDNDFWKESSASDDTVYYNAQRSTGDIKEGPSLGTYLTTDYSVAAHYAGLEGRISEYSINIQNPLRITPVDEGQPDWFETDELNAQMQRAGVKWKFPEDWDDVFWRFLDDGGMKFVQAMKKAGYDSLVYPESQGYRNFETTLVFDKGKLTPTKTASDDSTQPPDGTKKTMDTPKNDFGAYNRFVEWLPTELVAKFREYDREDVPKSTDSSYLDQLTEDIKQNGIKEPLLLEYSRSTKKALLTEGNHRLAAAIRLGLPSVPVRVYRRESAFNRGAGVAVPGFDETPFWHEEYKREITPHVPADMKPGDIGVGPYGKKTATTTTNITQTPAFKAWFGRSKVVDKQGHPMVMYHATQSDIDVFHPYTHFGTQGAANDRDKSLRDFYDEIGNPARGAGANIVPVYLSVTHPLRMQDLASIDDNTGEWLAAPDQYADEDEQQPYARSWEGDESVITTLLEMEIINTDEFWEYQYKGNEAAFKLLGEKGYDGIVYKNTVEDPGSDSWIVFSPSQIKSAIGNSNFDATQHSITARKYDSDAEYKEQSNGWALNPDQREGNASDNVDVLDAAIVASTPEVRHEYGLLEVVVPPELILGKIPIAEEDLAGDGREMFPHCTVTYGLEDSNIEGLKELAKITKPFTITLGKTSAFPPSKIWGGTTPVIVLVNSPELHRLNAMARKYANFKESDFDSYVPHITLFYSKPDAAEKYKGLDTLEGTEIEVTSLVVSDPQDNKTELPLGDTFVSKTAFASDYLPASFDEWVKAEGGIDNLIRQYDWDLGDCFEYLVDQDLPKEEQEKEYTRMAYEQLEEAYYNYQWEHDRRGSEFDVYRCIALEDIRNLKRKGMGIYWSWSPEDAEAHWGRGGKSYVFRTRVKDSNVDWNATLFLNLDPSIGEEEKEIRLKPGIPLQITGWVEGRYRQGSQWMKPYAGWKNVTASAKQSFAPNGGVYLWAYVPDLQITNGDITHADWFSQIGVNCSGNSYDRIPRGNFQIDRRNKEVRISRMDKNDFVPDGLPETISRKFKTQSYEVSEPTPDGSYMQRVLAAAGRPLTRDEFYTSRLEAFKKSQAEDNGWRTSVLIHHGTDSITAEKIIETGYFESGNDWPSFFTTRKKEAEDYARMRAHELKKRGKDAQPFVLSLKVAPWCVTLNKGSDEVETLAGVPLYLNGTTVGYVKDEDLIKYFDGCNDPYWSYELYLKDYEQKGEASLELAGDAIDPELLVPTVVYGKVTGEKPIKEFNFHDLLSTYNWLKGKRDKKSKEMYKKVEKWGLRLQNQRKHGSDDKRLTLEEMRARRGNGVKPDRPEPVPFTKEEMREMRIDDVSQMEDYYKRKKEEENKTSAVKALYHVSFLNRLNSIAEQGLQPGSRGSIGGPAYDGYKQGRSFLTDARGVDFWLDRAEAFAYDSSDNPVEEGYIPVVLRVKNRAKWKAERDEHGSNDGGGEASYTSAVIPPEDIQYWNGTGWFDLENSFVDEETFKQYGDEEGYMLPDSPLWHPQV